MWQAPPPFGAARGSQIEPFLVEAVVMNIVENLLAPPPLPLGVNSASRWGRRAKVKDHAFRVRRAIKIVDDTSNEITTFLMNIHFAHKAPKTKVCMGVTFSRHMSDLGGVN